MEDKSCLQEKIYCLGDTWGCLKGRPNTPGENMHTSLVKKQRNMYIIVLVLSSIIYLEHRFTFI
jgi:hypothetical protein